MPETLVIDYAWVHPQPAAIKAAGYAGVVRYLSNDPSKDITPAEVRALHAAGLSIRLVWETTATRATQGWRAGILDRRAAEKRAAALGYPKGCPIFYAVDCDADPRKITRYFKGVNRNKHYPVGAYGSKRVVEALWTAGLASRLWQTEAWSGNSVSPRASLYQRVRPTHSIHGAKGGWDENVVLHPFSAWTPAAPTPKPAPAPKPGLSATDRNLIQQLIALLRRLLGGTK